MSAFMATQAYHTVQQNVPILSFVADDVLTFNGIDDRLRWGKDGMLSEAMKPVKWNAGQRTLNLVYWESKKKKG